MRSSRSVFASVAFLLFLVLASGSLFAAPVISNLNPTSGATGTSVIITGTGFGSSQGSSTVKFGGIVASVTNWSNTGTSITARVPSGTNPTSGATGTSVIITGTGFGSSQGSSTVKFGGIVASVTNWSNTGTSI